MLLVTIGAPISVNSPAALAGVGALAFLWIAVAWLVVKSLHELAHGIVCKRYGGSVRDGRLKDHVPRGQRKWLRNVVAESAG